MTDFNLRNAWGAAITPLQTDNRPDELITLHNDGHITQLEVMNNVWQYCANDHSLAAVAQRMATHADQWVQGTAMLSFRKIAHTSKG